MSRRKFMSSVSALGGGLCFLGASDSAWGKVPHRSALENWEDWRGTSPRRLSLETHRLAQRALSGEHGRSMKPCSLQLDASKLVGVPGNQRYGHAAMLVAEKAPIRVLPWEKVVGSSTLLEAPSHMTPVAGVQSTSHTTLGFHRVLKTGYRELRRQVEERLARGGFEPPTPLHAAAPGPEGAVLIPGAVSGCMTAAPDAAYDEAPLTVECYAKLDSHDRFNVIAANRDKSSRCHWELYSYVGGDLAAYLPGYAPAEVRSGHNITDGQWHYLAMTFDGGRVRLFVDGEPVADQAVKPEGVQGEAQGALHIGGYPGSPSAGLVGDVRVSRGVREISGAKPAFEADDDTLALWRMDENEYGSYLRDHTARENHASAVVAGGGKDLLEGMKLCLDAAEVWHKRYLGELDRLAAESDGALRTHYETVRKTLERVPENPPETFAEAVQSLWFMYAFQRHMGTWSGIGRFDEMLGSYLEKDLREGRITLDEAREYIAHFWIKGCEWIGAFDHRGSGDAQHYQNIILAGVDASGEEVCNDVTHLVLDVVEELHISDFPIAVRLNSNSPRRLLEHMAEVQRHGGGTVAMYNEHVVLDGLVKFGYELEEARTFTNDGCWEVLIPGRTTFAYGPFDALVLLNEVLGVLDGGSPCPEYDHFDELYGAFLRRLHQHVESHHRGADHWATGGHPTPLVSLFVEDCIERGRSYLDRGARYTVLAPHAGRLANVSNSLLAIKKLVYEEKRLSLREYVGILRADWEEREPFRREVLSRVPCYGNDNDEADAMMARVFEDYAAMVAEVPERNGVKRPAGISTFGREIGWAMDPNGGKATADGHRQGAVLATNFSPSPGTDQQGPTAVLQSYCKMDFTKTPNGATVELKVHPDSVRGDSGREALVGLMRTFVTLGGMFMHVDVVDTELLKKAQAHPEAYPNLAVRISGWSARFATLDRDWQDMLIQRTQQFA